MQKVSFALFVFSVVSLLTAEAKARVVFFADFDEGSKEAIPNQDVNELANCNWKPENPQQVWVLAPFANGTQGLKQTTEGCGNSGNTPLPGIDNFTNGIIQLEMSWGDDDSWGVIFRKSARNKGYLVVFGGNETPAVIVGLFGRV